MLIEILYCLFSIKVYAILLIVKCDQQKKVYFRKKLNKYKDSENIWKLMNELMNYKNKSSDKVSKLIDNDGNDLTENGTVCSQFANEFIVKSSVSDTSYLRHDINEYEKKSIWFKIQIMRNSYARRLKY